MRITLSFMEGGVADDGGRSVDVDDRFWNVDCCDLVGKEPEKVTTLESAAREGWLGYLFFAQIP